MAKLTLLGTDPENPKFDKTKYVLQCRAVVSWMRCHKVNDNGAPYNYARGTVILPTGCGKSFVGLMAVKKLQKLYSNRETKSIIVVPDSNLFKQWKSVIRSLKISNVEVYVINTVALGKKKYDCDLLIVDEVHVSPGEKFRQVFTKVNYKFNLNLTATIDRLDGLESFIKNIAPICFEKDAKEAVEKGWIADSLTINVPVFLNMKEEKNIEDLSKKISYYRKLFGGYPTMQSCMSMGNARTYALLNYKNEDPDVKGKELQVKALIGNRLVRERTEFLHNCEHKIKATIELLNEFKCKSITFSQSIKFADSIDELMGSECVVYHSNIPSGYRKHKKSKTFKTLRGAVSFAKRNNYKTPEEKNGVFIVSWFAKKKLSGKSIGEDNINKFLSNKKRIISAARGLDKGFDCDTILLGIDAARTRSEIDEKQKLGRLTRDLTYKDGTKKVPVFVCLYIPGTADEGWLDHAQKNFNNVVKCEDLDEAKKIIHNVLDKQIGKI